MKATISDKLTQPITIAEVKKVLGGLKNGAYAFALPQFSGTLQGYDFLAKASSAQLTELLDWSAAQVTKTTKALDEANQFRPSYAPAGRLTREQNSTLGMAEQALLIHQVVEFVLADRKAKGK